MVGVNGRTGTRWRYGRTVTSSSGAELHYQPMTTTTALLSARFLSEDERIVIGDQVRAGSSLRAIGRTRGLRTAMLRIDRGTSTSRITPCPPNGVKARCQ